MASFLQCVETNNGTYDPHLGKVIISLRSSTAAKDFFSRLSTQAIAATCLKVTLDWSFASADLVMLVDKIALSNVCDFTLDLQESHWQTPVGSLMRPGKGRYHSLLGLLSNAKIKRLTFTSVLFIGPRTSTLPKNHNPTPLQSFHYQGHINGFDDPRLAEIISLCPGLVDVRLGAISHDSQSVPKVDRALGSLEKLESLHRYYLYAAIPGLNIKNTTSPYGTVALREIMDLGMPYPTGSTGLLEAAIERSATTLEVLILRSKTAPRALNLIPLKETLPLTPHSSGLPFLKLTHLELLVDITPESFDLMARLLPDLSLVHFGVNYHTYNLLSKVNLDCLRSLKAQDVEESILQLFYDRVLSSSTPSQIQTLSFSFVSASEAVANTLAVLPLRRLYMYDTTGGNMMNILRRLNLSQLQVLVIDYSTFSADSEAVLATRSAELCEEFELQLIYERTLRKGESQILNPREEDGTIMKLPRRHVRVVGMNTAPDFYRSILPYQ
ncbi:hypothetical protein BGZ96_002722 [Linnemannia gamsii]|uniref:F-box domain-containing protein n=1 Tax=Linnemannia gamsii TaxID=64522 RepID=A0ABQ7JKF0_9FUNG|nr:hypothetical protein BGZ96_002722 [Linnemannia gamsii]